MGKNQHRINIRTMFLSIPRQLSIRQDQQIQNQQNFEVKNYFQFLSSKQKFIQNLYNFIFFPQFHNKGKFITKIIQASFINLLEMLEKSGIERKPRQAVYPLQGTKQNYQRRTGNFFGLPEIEDVYYPLKKESAEMKKEESQKFLCENPEEKEQARNLEKYEIQKESQEEIEQEIKEDIPCMTLSEKVDNQEFQSTRNASKLTSYKLSVQKSKKLLEAVVSSIWIFVMQGNLSEQITQRIRQMYNLQEGKNSIVPLIGQADEMEQFLKIPNTEVKVVADLESMPQVFKWKKRGEVHEMYIFNNKGQKGVRLSLEYKLSEVKVKGIYNSLDKIVDKAEQEISNQVQLFNSKNGIYQRKKQKKFPAFLKISGEDKTFATLYRANLYGAKNLPKDQRMQRFEEFMALVKSQYGDSQKEQQNIAQYQLFDHLNGVSSQQKARQIIKFYVSESFYYRILNSLLRVIKTFQEFKPCILPFNENYWAIKYFYQKDLECWGRIIPAQTLYRGARLRKRDFNILKPGIFIEMLGFMSTSKNKEKAIQFTDGDGYLFVIHVPQMLIPQNFDQYDHGFIDINHHKLAQFQAEEEVLFNALNIYKVLKIDNDGQYKYIHLLYGPIFDLLSKSKNELSIDERDVLTNYQYCVGLSKEIEDEGDVHLLAHQFRESEEYYEDKLKRGANDEKYFYKLANVLQKSGKLSEAQKNVRKSLEINLNLVEGQKQLQVFSIYSKYAEISFENEDYLIAQNCVLEAISQIKTDELQDCMEKVRKHSYLGKIRFKKGEMVGAQQSLYQGLDILQSLKNKSKIKREELDQFSFWKCLSCSNVSEEQKRQKLKDIQKMQARIERMREQIQEQKMKINDLLKEIYIYIEDNSRYQQCLRRGRKIYRQMQEKQPGDLRNKAEYLAMIAKYKSCGQFNEKEQLLQKAIHLIEIDDPFDELAGRYREILADLQKAELRKYFHPDISTPKLDEKIGKILYDPERYDRCRQNYEKSLQIMLHNNEPAFSRKMLHLKNSIAELDYENQQFEKSETILNEVRKQLDRSTNSEISKAFLLLSKISYERGEIKDSRFNIDKAYKILLQAIRKKQSPEYVKIFESHQLTLELKMQMMKIFIKYRENDQCGIMIKSVQEVVNRKQGYNKSHLILADLIEIQGKNLSYMYEKSPQPFKCDKYFLEAISMRKKQLGQSNLPNAFTYINYIRYLLREDKPSKQDKKMIKIMLNRATEIFGRLSPDYPQLWIVLYTYGLIAQKQINLHLALQNFQNCLHIIDKKVDKSKITVKHLQMKYATNLYNTQQFQRCIEELRKLQSELEEDLLKSSKKTNLEHEMDDEKLRIKKELSQWLLKSYQRLIKVLTERTMDEK